MTAPTTPDNTPTLQEDQRVTDEVDSSLGIDAPLTRKSDSSVVSSEASGVAPVSQDGWTSGSWQSYRARWTSEASQASTLAASTLLTALESACVGEKEVAWEELSETESFGSTKDELVETSHSEVWSFEFEQGLAPCQDVPERMEQLVESVSTLASEVTLATASQSLRPSDPAPAYASGPPFATGAIVVADVSPDRPLERAFVVEANHPWYFCI